MKGGFLMATFCKNIEVLNFCLRFEGACGIIENSNIFDIRIIGERLCQ